MTARERLLALRARVVGTLLTRALLVGAAVACAGLSVVHALALGDAGGIAAWLAGLSAAAVAARRANDARSLERVALWVEERHGSLRYALVAAASGAGSQQVDRQALALPWWRDADRALVRALLLPALALLAALMLLRMMPVLAPTDAAAGLVSGSTRHRITGTDDALARVRAVVTPPAYARRSASSADDPTSLDGLAGSVIVISGSGDARELQATVDSVARGIASRGERWSVTLAMPARPALVRLRGPNRERLLVLAPVADAAPVVTLLFPARDTIVRTASGVMTLRAQLRDDIGLRDAQFEVIVSSGAGENFTFRSTVLARRGLAGASESLLEARLSLDSLALKPGDVVQLRATARDANDVTGPGLGSSETRAIRVARAGEGDSVSVDAAPPAETEGQVLSQRMLITLAEALARRKGQLTRATLMDESGRLASDQARLRRRVGDIVFQRLGNDPLSEEGTEPLPSGKVSPEELLKRADAATGSAAAGVMDVEGDETPILSINKPLLEAFNAMWDAGRALDQGEPGPALPFMRRALAAIQRARQAERIYLRGRPSAVVVDVARARLAGKDKGTSSDRAPAPPLDPVVRRRSDSFARASALLARDPAAAADTLLVMRVGALGDAPALAAALGDAARVARRGDASAAFLALVRVRRLIAGTPVRRDALPAWGGAR